MSTIESEITVVGASACGSLAAKSAASTGKTKRVLMLEEDPKPGKYGKCSGIMSKKGLDSLNVDYKPAIVNEIHGARVWSSGTNTTSKHFKIETKHVQAIVLDRQHFDEICCAEAQDAGAELKTGARVAKALPGQNLLVDSKQNEYSFNQLIGADGADSTIARLYNFPRIPASKFVLAYEAEFEHCNLPDERLVDVFLDQKTFPGFFGWIIPSGNSRARIGLAVKNHSQLNACKQAFFQFPQVQRATGNACVKCREFYHVIPLAVRAKTQLENVYLCGDAAGQVKSTTGGGVVFGGNCARIAGEIAAHNASAAQNNSANQKNQKPRSYEKEWRTKYEKALSAHSKIRTAFDIAPQWLLDTMVSGVKLTRGTKLIEKFGDMDYIANI